MAWLLQGIAGILKGFCPFIQQGWAELTKILGRVVHIGDCRAQFIQTTMYVLWGCSLAILQAAPSWWGSPADGNQGLSEHCEVWYYCLGSGSYPRNAAWQMALRRFAKCPRRPHQWSICLGAQWAIWHHCEKLHRHVQSHHQLGLYKSGTFAGSALQVNDVP